MSREEYVIGVDFGTDSVRCLIADPFTGAEVATAVYNYPRWKEGLYCDPSVSRFRQHPLDYIEGLENVVKEALAAAGPAVAKNIKALSIDTTGSTPALIDHKGTPLALTKGFENDPNAMFILWKDHTAIQEAQEINERAAIFDINYLQYAGGIYSSEWFWAKLLHVLRSDEQVRAHAYSFAEHCDWMPFLLTGGTDAAAMKRGVCAAGHKALWSERWKGLPPNDFFVSIDTLLDGWRSRLYNDTYTASEPAGTLCAEWAERLGLSTSVLVGIGALDAHVGAVGGQVEPYYLTKVMGTSTCDMMVVPVGDMKEKPVRGICGQVNDSIIPGLCGLEAGQSAFGDIYAWFKNIISWPLQFVKDEEERNRIAGQLIPELSKAAAALPLSSNNSEIAIDWMNGRRTPDADQSLKGALAGLNLASDAPVLFRTLAEATCFGARRIVDRFVSEGVPVKGITALGGVARKSPFIMQLMADIMNRPVRIHKSEQSCALGAAMFAATVAGIHSDIETAMKAMGPGFDTTYTPAPDRAAYYEAQYKRYLQFGELIERRHF